MPPLLQVCLNGPRTRADHPRLPITPEELAVAAAKAVAAGARDIHLHPKDADGGDTLEPAAVGAAVEAVRHAVPAGVRIGVTTGAWAAPEAARRAALIRSWQVLPDHASVNWHEEGADLVAEALLERGVGIEAGIYSGTDAVGRFAASRFANRVQRVLAEVTDVDPRTAPGVADALLTRLADLVAPDTRILLHGEDGGAWPVLHVAVKRRLAVRIGLEDVLVRPDGTPARDNAELVELAACVLERGV